MSQFNCENALEKIEAMREMLPEHTQRDEAEAALNSYQAAIEEFKSPNTMLPHRGHIVTAEEAIAVQDGKITKEEQVAHQKQLTLQKLVTSLENKGAAFLKVKAAYLELLKYFDQIDAGTKDFMKDFDGEVAKFNSDLSVLVKFNLDQDTATRLKHEIEALGTSADIKKVADDINAEAIAAAEASEAHDNDDYEAASVDTSKTVEDEDKTELHEGLASLNFVDMNEGVVHNAFVGDSSMLKPPAGFDIPE